MSKRTVPDNTVPDNTLHSDFLRYESAAFIEFHGSCVERPDVEGEVIKALAAGKIHHVLIERTADMLTAGGFIHAEVVDVEGADVGEVIVVDMLLVDAEAVAQHRAVAGVGDEDGTGIVMNDGGQLVVGVLAGSGLASSIPLYLALGSVAFAISVDKVISIPSGF